MPIPDSIPKTAAMVVHVIGCQGIAFYLEKRPISGKTMLTSGSAWFPDGTPIVEASMARCGSCSEPVELKELAVPPPKWKLGDPINVRARR